MSLVLYGHPFSSYTWKALIPLYASEIPFEFRALGPDEPDNSAFVAASGPAGKFPVLRHGDRTVFEATTIIEYLNLNIVPEAGLIPANPQAALTVRQMDRVFDNYVMGNMQDVVNEHLRNPEAPDADRMAEARARLAKAYDWLEQWLTDYPPGSTVTLVECAAAPALFYADWVLPIGDARPRLAAWRAWLLALPAVSRCVEDARPFRAYFPPGAPDRD